MSYAPTDSYEAVVLQNLLPARESYRNVRYNANPFQTARRSRTVDSPARKSALAESIEVWP